MQLRELKELVANTADAAFAIDASGTITAWNPGAEALFGYAAADALGRFCADVVHASDELGPVCGPYCSVLQSVRKGRPLSNFDLEVATGGRRTWCNVSVLLARVSGAKKPYSIHIVRATDTCKRMELLLRDVVARATGLPAERALQGAASARPAASASDLSKRELEILRLLANGSGTASIAQQLSLQRTTVNNHVQRILRKLQAHTRLEAVRRAEIAGLV